MPRIQVDPRDNVAIVTQAEGGIPEAHKVALTDMAVGDAIIRYGVVIGYAEAPIAKGSWVHEGVMSLPAPPPLDQLPVCTQVPQPLPPLAGYTFDGFVNHDGSVGTKNILGIASTVQCVAATVEFAVKRI